MPVCCAVRVLCLVERLQKTSTTTTLVAPENDESQGQPEQVVQPKKKPPLPPAGPAPIRTTSAPRTPGIGPAPPRPKHGPSSLPRPHTIQPLGRSWQPQPDIYGVCQVKYVFVFLSLWHTSSVYMVLKKSENAFKICDFSLARI